MQIKQSSQKVSLNGLQVANLTATAPTFVQGLAVSFDSYPTVQHTMFGELERGILTRKPLGTC